MHNVIDETDRNTIRIEQIRHLFAQVLDRDSSMINLEKSFFEQGGSSMRLVQLMALLRRDLSYEMDIEEFFHNPCVVHVAKTISIIGN